MRSIEYIAIGICLGVFLQPRTLSGAVVAWDSMTTNTMDGVSSTGSNGYLFENDVTVVTSFGAGGDTYTLFVEFPTKGFLRIPSARAGKGTR